MLSGLIGLGLEWTMDIRTKDDMKRCSASSCRDYGDSLHLLG